MSRNDPRWEGPINSELQHTAVVRDPSRGDAVIETRLEGLAAIASGLFAVEHALTRIADSVDPLGRQDMVNR